MDEETLRNSVDASSGNIKWVGRGKPSGGFHKQVLAGTLEYMAPEVRRPGSARRHSRTRDAKSPSRRAMWLLRFTNWETPPPHGANQGVVASAPAKLCALRPGRREALRCLTNVERRAAVCLHLERATTLLTPRILSHLRTNEHHRRR